MVSHDLDSIATLCDRVVWLDHGRMRQIGPAADVVDSYRNNVQGVDAATPQAA